jgi:hypothetical protein
MEHWQSREMGFLGGSTHSGQTPAVRVYEDRALASWQPSEGNATQPSGNQAGCAAVIRLKARRARSAFMAS